VPDTRKLRLDPARSRIWPSRPRSTPGIEWRGEEQIRLLEELSSQEPMAFPEGPTGEPTVYHTANPMFPLLDAWVLQAMLRHARPKRMIEIGCGWSSLVAARVNREHLGGEMELTCIDPYPPDFLSNDVEGISTVIDAPVEELGVDRFLDLGANDVLFVDSTHTVKTGGDVSFLFGQVLPRLSGGVLVHVHDIFLPSDYPQEWVLAGWAWNEQYLVQSFLAFNAAFEVVLSVAWLSQFRPAALAEASGVTSYAGSSLWIRRRA
jgi:hypothetical protein